MASQNHFKYVCIDCGNEQFQSKMSMQRKCRPRCTSCGSTFLSPKTAESRDRIVDGNDAAKINAAMIEDRMGYGQEK